MEILVQQEWNIIGNDVSPLDDLLGHARVSLGLNLSLYFHPKTLSGNPYGLESIAFEFHEFLWQNAPNYYKSLQISV